MSCASFQFQAILNLAVQAAQDVDRLVKGGEVPAARAYDAQPPVQHRTSTGGFNALSRFGAVQMAR